MQCPPMDAVVQIHDGDLRARLVPGRQFPKRLCSTPGPAPLLDAVRGDGFVALATASSGVAAQLMQNGTTVHSRFKVPINVKQTSTCNFTSRDATGRLISMTKLIIIDEMTMQHKFVYECIDRSLRDLISVCDVGNNRSICLLCR